MLWLQMHVFIMINAFNAHQHSRFSLFWSNKNHDIAKTSNFPVIIGIHNRLFIHFSHIKLPFSGRISLMSRSVTCLIFAIKCAAFFVFLCNIDARHLLATQSFQKLSYYKTYRIAQIGFLSITGYFSQHYNIKYYYLMRY